MFHVLNKYLLNAYSAPYLMILISQYSISSYSSGERQAWFWHVKRYGEDYIEEKR